MLLPLSLLVVRKKKLQQLLLSHLHLSLLPHLKLLLPLPHQSLPLLLLPLTPQALLPLMQLPLLAPPSLALPMMQPRRLLTLLQPRQRSKLSFSTLLMQKPPSGGFFFVL